MNSLRDEINFVFSEQGGKYYIAAFVVVIVVVILFSCFFSNNYIKDGKVAVIDLDNSAYSRQLIDKFDSSAYIGVEVVYNEMRDPEKLLYHDQYIGVIYLPKGLEVNRYRNTPNSIGLFLDNTNAALTGNLRNGIMEIIAVENIEIGMPRIKELGVNSDQAIGIMSNIHVNNRVLFNSNDSSSNTTVMAFIFMFPSIFYAMAVLPIIARLRITGRWESEVVNQNVWHLISRILPYTGIYMTSILFGLGLIKVLSDFRFAGNVIEFIFPLFLYSLSVALFSMILAWRSANPGIAMSKMTFIIPPGFILGGATSPIAILPDWALWVAHVFPLTWIFKFTRSIGLRGADLLDLPIETFGFILYVLILGSLVSFLFWKEKKSWVKAKTPEYSMGLQECKN